MFDGDEQDTASATRHGNSKNKRCFFYVIRVIYRLGEVLTKIIPDSLLRTNSGMIDYSSWGVLDSIDNWNVHAGSK